MTRYTNDDSGVDIARSYMAAWLFGFVITSILKLKKQNMLEPKWQSGLESMLKIPISAALKKVNLSLKKLSLEPKKIFRIKNLSLKFKK